MGMTAILINGQWSFILFNFPLKESSTWSLKKFGPGVSEEKSFKGVEGRTDGELRIQERLVD